MLSHFNLINHSLSLISKKKLGFTLMISQNHCHTFVLIKIIDMKVGIITAIFSLVITSSVFTQSEFLERQAEKAKNKAVNRVENKIDNGVDKAMDKTEEGIEGSVKKDKQKKSKEKTSDPDPNQSDSQSSNNKSNENNSSKSNKSELTPLKAYSKFDFVSGEKVLGFESYEETSIGDFPLGWNSNGSAEIITLGSDPEKWLYLKQDGYYSPEFVKDIPENFTLEFDVFTRNRSSNIVSYGFDLCSVENPRKNISLGIHAAKAGFEFEWSACIGSAGYNVYEDGKVSSSNDDLNSKDLACGGEDYTEYSKVHFSLWRQKNRIRIYANDTKIIDVPYGLPIEYSYNIFRFKSRYMNLSTHNAADEYMVSNMRYAVGAPDTRSKLITEGKLVSRGILFNVNSDEIKAESYGTLKDIAKVLQENPTVKVQIVGHTDSDGDDNSNMDLSKKRAESVKKALITEFQIDKERLSADGKGESQPSDPNSTPSGKANNRRVEFIKL